MITGIAAVVDGGDLFTELHGVEIRGVAERVGDVLRGVGRDDALTDVERSSASSTPGATNSSLRVRMPGCGSLRRRL
jgi:hypothetical protein